MVPQVLLQLIHKYNEIGIFVTKKYKVYWFNGKRLEFWMNWDGKIIFTFENNLYSYDQYVFVRKTKQWSSIKMKEIWNNSLNIAYQNATQVDTVLLNKIQYTMTNYVDLTIFDGTLIHFSSGKNHFGYGHSMFAFNNHIYCFGKKSEKYNPRTNLWTDIADCPNQKSPDFYFFGNCFYANTEYIYYPDIDRWDKLISFGIC